MFDQISKLNEQLDELKQRRKVSGERKRFRTRYEQIKEPADKLEPLVTLMLDLVKRGVQVENSAIASKAAEFAKIVAGMRSDFQQDPMKLLDPSDEMRYKFWHPLKSSYVGDLRKTLLDAWQKHAETLIPSGRQDVLETLGRIAGFGLHVKRIRELGTQVDQLVKTLPDSASRLDDLALLADELRSAWSNIDGDAVPQEIVDFLGSAGGAGASLDQLTPQVILWLEEHNILRGQLRIQLKGAELRRT